MVVLAALGRSMIGHKNLAAATPDSAALLSKHLQKQMSLARS